MRGAQLAKSHVTAFPGKLCNLPLKLPSLTKQGNPEKITEQPKLMSPPHCFISDICHFLLLFAPNMQHLHPVPFDTQCLSSICSPYTMGGPLHSVIQEKLLTFSFCLIVTTL